MEFRDLKLDARIMKVIGEAGYDNPSPIQEQAIPAVLAKRDVLGCAQTGTGKTAAFAMPILQLLASKGQEYPRRIKALVLTPTRELALQIHESFRTYGKYMKLKVGVIMGGVSQKGQTETIKSGIDILVATPGRLLDLISQGIVELRYLDFFVLDEADRMLDMGFIHDVKRIIAQLPEKRQTLFFTATMPPEVLKLTNILLDKPLNISVTPISSTVEAIDQSVYLTDKSKKNDLLAWLLRNNHDMESTLIFTRTKHGANKVSTMLEGHGISSLAIHGNKSQSARQFALTSFKEGKIKALVATDIAARGLDIKDLSHVVNYDLPEVPEAYVHRIGRTGRAGKSGVSISFCDFNEMPLLKEIERLIRKKVTVMENHPYPMSNFEKPEKKESHPSRRGPNKKTIR